MHLISSKMYTLLSTWLCNPFALPTLIVKVVSIFRGLGETAAGSTLQSVGLSQFPFAKQTATATRITMTTPRHSVSDQKVLPNVGKCEMYSQDSCICLGAPIFCQCPSTQPCTGTRGRNKFFCDSCVSTPDFWFLSSYALPTRPTFESLQALWMLMMRIQSPGALLRV
jgi:hypothetical protein